MTGIGSPTEKPPSAKPSNGSAQISLEVAAAQIERRRRPGRCRSAAGRRARGAASSAAPSGWCAPWRRRPRRAAASPGGSDRRPWRCRSRASAWISIETSGVSVRGEPSTGERKVTPSSVSLDSCDEREDLEAARVGEHGARPADHLVQAAVRGDDLEAGAQPQVIGVAEDDARADGLELARGHRLDGAVGADRHEDGRRDLAVRERERAGAGVAVGGRRRGTVGRRHVSSIASP